MKPRTMITTKEREFLWESNCIENERSPIALVDAEAAWIYVRRLSEAKRDIVVDDVLKIHEILMKHLRPDIAGQIRKVAVRIGYSIKKAEHEDVIKGKIYEALTMTNSFPAFTDKKLSKKEGREEWAKTAHVMFEDVHPFEDGNGRTGRILWNIHRKRLGLPLGIIHADTPEQLNYYKWFRDNNF